jgi:protein-disulfide isomerase
MIHPYAFEAAEAACCAGDQGKFWEIRDAVMSSSAPPTDGSVIASADKAGLDLKSFRLCLGSEKYRQQVQADADEAAALQIRGTPTFIIARTREHDVEGVPVAGALPYSASQAKIDVLLSAVTAQRQ